MGFDCRLEEEKLPPPSLGGGAPAARLGPDVSRIPRTTIIPIKSDDITFILCCASAAKRVSFNSKVSQQPGKGRWRKSGFTELQEPLWGILPHEYADVLSRKLHLVNI